MLRERGLVMRRQRGFTLIEMMVVVAIIAILAGLMISLSSRPVGANARTVSEQVVSTINFAKLRAAATRKIHRVQIQPQNVTVWQATTTGLVLPVTPTWSLIQTLTIPTGVRVWEATAGATTSTGNTQTENPALDYSLDIRPDSQATGTTIWVSDTKHQFRVLTYHVTGATYAREFW